MIKSAVRFFALLLSSSVALAGADLNAVNADGETALIQAVNQQQEAKVKSLIKKKADVNIRDNAGNTALFYAVSNNELGMVKALIKAGASVDEVFGTKKENLLFEAARVGSKEITDALIVQNKSLLNQTNTEGKSAVHEAISNAQSGLALHLLERGSSAKLKLASGQSLLDFAIENKVKETSPLMKYLLKSGK